MLYKGIEGEGWGELYDAYKEMSRAVGMKMPQEAQKARALWKMKAAKDAGGKYYDPTREDNTLGRNKTISALSEKHLKDPIVALDKALKCVENVYGKYGPQGELFFFLIQKGPATEPVGETFSLFFC